MFLGLLTAICKISKGNKVEAKITAVKENTCDTTVKALIEQVEQKLVFNVRTGATFVDDKTPKLLSKLIPYIKSHENISEDTKKEFFIALANSEYFKPSPNQKTSQQDRLIQESIQNMLNIEIQQQQDDSLTQQMLQEQQQMFDQMNTLL